MDAFEELVANIFRRNHFWTCTSYKVNLTKEVKKALHNHSMPRAEIDVLAFRPVSNDLLWIECKSYLDSPGVKMAQFTGSPHDADRLKMFNNQDLREAVTVQLVKQLTEDGLLTQVPQVRYCLVAGKIATEKDRTDIRAYFDSRGWLLYDEHWVRAELVKFAKLGYENDTATMVAKLFARYKETNASIPAG